MKLRLVAVCMILLAFGVPATSADNPVAPKGSVCWPLHWSGIVVGTTTDSEVQRLLGPGVFRKDEGDTGGRYYTDSQGTATLHVVSFTDSVVGELTISAGIDPEIKQNERKAAITKWFNPREGFGNWGALNLGSSRMDVLKNLGEPKKKSAEKGWKYDSICACELPVYFTVFFKNDRVSKVVFSAPAG